MFSLTSLGSLREDGHCRLLSCEQCCHGCFCKVLLFLSLSSASLVTMQKLKVKELSCVRKVAKNFHCDLNCKLATCDPFHITCDKMISEEMTCHKQQQTFGTGRMNLGQGHNAEALITSAIFKKNMSISSKIRRFLPRNRKFLQKTETFFMEQKLFPKNRNFLQRTETMTHSTSS